MRAVVTVLCASFATLAEAGGGAGGGAGAAGADTVPYGPGAQRFAGATYDPTSHYRAARVFRFFADQGLTPDLLRQSYLHQLDVLTRTFDALEAPDHVITRDR